MSLAEGVAASIRYKFYASAAITPGTLATSSSALGVTSAQVLRRVASTLALTKDTYQSAEIRSDRQVADFRHGVKRVTGNISGELSPLTYEQLFEASMRGTWAAAITATEADFTSVTADSPTSKFTFTAGDPITKGFRVGMGVRFTDLSTAGNNSTNFIILAMGGTNGREWTVYPAPTTMGADAAFSLTSVGRSLIIPASSHVSRKLGIEIYSEDTDVSRLFCECRAGGFNVQLPATGMATVDFEYMGRDMETYTAGSAPFFTSPTAATSTGITAGVNGLLRVSGETVAVITGLNIQHQAALEGPAVVGSNLVPEIFVGRHMVSGQMTALFEDVDLIDDFRNESEIEILAYLTTTSAVNSPAMTFFLPRVKLGGADLQTAGEGGQTITLPFQALKYETAVATAGIENTTLQIWDSEVTA
jgi:hypothetical protein